MASSGSFQDGDTQSKVLTDEKDQETTEQPSDSNKNIQGQPEMDYASAPFYLYGQTPSMVSPYAMQSMMNALPPYQQPPHFGQTFNQAHFIQNSFNRSQPYQTHYRQSIPHQNPDQYISHNIQHFQTHVPRPNFIYGAHGTGVMSNPEAMYSPHSQYIYGANLPSMPSIPHRAPYPGQERFFHEHYSDNSQPRHSGNNLNAFSNAQSQPHINALSIQRSQSPSQGNSTLRGPPRKPRQSGHALWVGNLPSGTHITALKDHFSTDATKEIESVFLISKSNCAFVNYKTEEACMAAMSRFHDSLFGGARLVCRHRRGSNSSSPAPAPASHSAETNTPAESSTELDSAVVPAEVTTQAPAAGDHAPKIPDDQRVKEKFFIIKSLTVDDLERSVSSGVWATQTHNEEPLNRAFQESENVYLIFSANKSGEYFGCARMESLISAQTTDHTATEPAVSKKAETEVTKSVGSRKLTDVPVAIRTPATSTAPEGRIIDDSGRGTIFWEVINDQAVAEEVSEAGESDANSTAGGDPSNEPALPQPAFFGNSFAIKWQSTERLPFYRTRGLRNPWNANREVKIARDGTELEPGVGRKLLNMFEQQTQINMAARGPESGHYGQFPHSAAQQNMYHFG